MTQYRRAQGSPPFVHYGFLPTAGMTMNRLYLLLSILLICSLTCRSALRHQRQAPLERSASLLASGDTLEAIRTLQALLYDVSPPPSAFTLLGSLLRSRGTIRARLESQQILEEGLRFYPDDTAICFELGKTYYAQQFYPDASRCFQRVLKSDSTNCEVLHCLGRNHFRKWKRNRGYTDELEHAVSFFSRAQACNPADGVNAFYHAFSYLALGDSSSCRAICQESLGAWPDDVRFMLLFGVLEFYGGCYRSASELFDLALALMSANDRLYYLDISPLLDDDTRAEYQSIPAPRKKQMLRTYWIENDPDPTTEVNERYLEHLSRSILADFYFSDGYGAPGRRRTDRGTALIKFGWPTRIEYGLGGGLTGRFEKWTYLRNDDAFQFTFMDEFLNDRFSIPMDEGYMKRELVEKSSESAIIRAAGSLPGRMNIYSFADGQRITENYLYLAIDYTRSGLLSEHSESSVLKLRTTVFDDAWRKIEHFEQTIQPETYQIGSDSSLYAARKIDLPFGEFRFAATFEDSLSLFRSIFRADVHVARFLGETLTLSDLVLFKQPEFELPIPPLERNGHMVTPCVYHRYRHGEKLGVYFEIYNLKKLNLRSDYEISYFIFEAPPGGTSSWEKIRSAISGSFGLSRPDPPAISQTIAFSGTAHSAFETLLIEIGSLEPGRYELQISVLDLIASERTTSSVLFYCTAKM